MDHAHRRVVLGSVASCCRCERDEMEGASLQRQHQVTSNQPMKPSALCRCKLTHSLPLIRPSACPCMWHRFRWLHSECLPRRRAVAHFFLVRVHMEFRAGSPADAEAIAALIASFQSELTDDPSGAGAERYLASVSVQAEREYLASERYRYLLAYSDSQLAGFIAIRDGSDRKSTRLNSSHVSNSYAVFCLKN